ncbi:MAG: YjbE family putative metal transport protein [Gammaproteobacteria bacterium]|nr:YjbE family putative metal transport protein [Gammaproteobacteria bacterium]
MELLDSFYKLVQVILVDLVLAGDNAIVIGLVAARFTKDYRRKVIFYGVGVAVLLRIIFALLTVQLLQIQGLLLFGGVLLLWICWKLWQELRTPVALPEELDEDGEVKENPPLLSAISQIIIADLSMSLDNVIAVAGVADGNNTILVIGLTLSIVFMTVAASFLANVLQKHRWIGYAGLVVILYVSIKMITEGYIQIFG